jgi:hypothetical protein
MQRHSAWLWRCIAFMMEKYMRSRARHAPPTLLLSCCKRPSHVTVMLRSGTRRLSVVLNAGSNSAASRQPFLPEQAGAVSFQFVAAASRVRMLAPAFEEYNIECHGAWLRQSRRYRERYRE